MELTEELNMSPESPGDLDDELIGLQKFYENILSDLNDARKRKQETGPHYKMLADYEAKIAQCKYERNKKETECRDKNPDMTKNQTILSTGSVRRKSDSSLKEVLISKPK